MTAVPKPLKSVNTVNTVNSLLLVGIMAATGLAATAQTRGLATPATSAAPSEEDGYAGKHMGRHDPAKMQAHRARRQAELKAKLKITPAQEAAWAGFTASMQGPARGTRPTPEQRAEFDKLNTPERIDKMRVLRTQHMAERRAFMDKRDGAVKTFYAALDAEQKKVFDSQRMGGRGHGGQHDPHRKG